MSGFAECWADRASAVVFLVTAATSQSHGACQDRQGGDEIFHGHGGNLRFGTTLQNCTMAKKVQEK